MLESESVELSVADAADVEPVRSLESESLEPEAAELSEEKKLSRLSSSWASRSALEAVDPDVLDVAAAEVESEVVDVLELAEASGGGPGGGPLIADEASACDDESPDVDVPVSLEDIDIRYAIRSEVMLPTAPLAVDEESAVVEEVELVSDEEVEEVPLVEAPPELCNQFTSAACLYWLLMDKDITRLLTRVRHGRERLCRNRARRFSGTIPGRCRADSAGSTETGRRIPPGRKCRAACGAQRSEAPLSGGVRQRRRTVMRIRTHVPLANPAA